MSTLTRWLDQTWYPQYQRNWDDVVFRQHILSHISRQSVVLDIGAGAGIIEQMNFRGIANKVYGVDLDPRVLNNRMLDEALIGDAGTLPYDTNQFDVVFSDNLLEHLDNPLKAFREVTRVLKPSGVFLFKTPNKWHYMPVIARATPHSFHKFINKWRGRTAADIFPTRYRANTRRTIVQLAGDCGLVVERIERLEGRPEYLRMMGFTYLMGAAYERLVNATEWLSPFRILLIGVLRK